jgi:hypothetical protein
MQVLAEAGVGRFRAGRRGKPTRLELAVPAKELVDSANGNGKIPPTASQASSNADGTFEFRFPLRHDYEVRVELPVNWDADARQRLANAILALPTA